MSFETTEVNLDHLWAHRNKVDGLAEMIGTARTAADTAQDMSYSAFGIICSFINVPMSIMSRTMRDTLEHTQGSMEWTAATLADTAEDYQIADEAAAENMHSLLGRFDVFGI